MKENMNCTRLLAGSGADAVLITDPLNMRYLSGFKGGEGMLYISAGRHILITDSRYTEVAHKESDFELIEEKRDHKRTEIVKELVSAESAGSLAFEDQSMRCS